MSAATVLGEGMSMPDFVVDMLYYNSKRHPEQNRLGQWPLSTVIKPPDKQPSNSKRKRHSDTVPTVAPSVALKIRRMCSSDTVNTDLHMNPVYTNLQSAVKADIYKTLLLANTFVRSTSGPIAHVPTNFSDYEDTQLVYNRESTRTKKLLAKCSSGAECDALTYANAPKQPLDIFLYPHEQDHFNNTGILSDTPQFCLLCIRQNVLARALLHEALILTPASTCSRDNCVIPPFRNLVDVPGGYKSSCFGVRSSTSYLLPVDIVGVSGQLVFRKDINTGRMWFDQSAIKFGCDRLNE